MDSKIHPQISSVANISIPKRVENGMTSSILISIPWNLDKFAQTGSKVTRSKLKMSQATLDFAQN